MKFVKDFNDLTLKEISEIVAEKQIRYEVHIEPTGYGSSNITVTIEPLEQFDPKCPYGTPVFYVKGKQEGSVKSDG